VKKNLLPLLVLACLTSSVALTLTACGSLRSEFLGPPPAPPTLTTNYAPTIPGSTAPPVVVSITSTPAPAPVSVTPPISDQLRAAGPIVNSLVPQPYGALAAAAMNLLATGAAAFATFRAGRAAASNSKTIAVAAALPSLQVQTK
jgi:hypothetical protein